MLRPWPVHHNIVGIRKVEIKGPSRLLKLVIDHMELSTSILSIGSLPQKRPSTIQGMLTEFSFLFGIVLWETVGY